MTQHPTDPDDPAGAADTPVVVVTIAAPVAEVWQALRDRGRVHHWHGWEADGLDDEITEIYFSDEVAEDGTGHTLALGGGDRIELLPDGEGTRVRLTRPPVSDDDEWAAYYDDITEGWVTFLQQLRFALENHPDAPRRTLFHSGVGRAPDPASLAEGSTWFRTEHQLGTRVPAWGDGLLVTAHIPTKNTAMAVLTTYGLDDAAFADLDAAARAWWDGRPGATDAP